MSVFSEIEVMVELEKLGFKVNVVCENGLCVASAVGSGGFSCVGDNRLEALERLRTLILFD